MRRFLLLLLITFIGLPAIADAQGRRPKELAPGVLHVIPAVPDARDSFSLPMSLPGLTTQEWDPNFATVQETLHGQTQAVILYRDVYQYEFAFLGLRQMRIEVPVGDGGQKGQNVWYLPYRIRNTGKSLSYERVKEDPKFDQYTYELVRDDESKSSHGDHFLPRFSLEGWIPTTDGQYNRVVYRDQVRPEIRRLIQQREDPNRVLLDAIGMSQAQIPLAKSEADDGVWGVAIWINVDPRIDFASVYVDGLTNAYRLTRNEDGSTGRKDKVLQLNFWRAGDSVYEVADSIRYGIPLVDNPVRQVEITRRYDLPGPIIRGYLVSQKADRNVLVMEADAGFNLTDFKSDLIPQLDGGQLPESLSKAFAASGISIPTDVPVATAVQGLRWSLQAGDREYVLSLEPQYWEPAVNGGIRFIKSLDHLWIYR